MEEKLKDKDNFISGLLKNDKYKKAIIIFGLIGILLIFCSNFFKKSNDNKKIPILQETSKAEDYKVQLEKNLVDIVSSIMGAGQSKVLVTIENGTETVYATEAKNNKEASEDKLDGQTTRKQESDDVETKYIKVKDSSGTEKALAITEIQPKVKGVVIVCTGGDDPVVQKRIIEAVTTALNITSKRVCVTKLS